MGGRSTRSGYVENGGVCVPFEKVLDGGKRERRKEGGREGGMGVRCTTLLFPRGTVP